MKYLAPVIHVNDEAQALRNAEICLNAGTKGFFLINHRIPCAELARIAAAVRTRFSKAWIGVNILDEHPLTAIPQLPPIDGYWTDDPQLIEGQSTQALAQAIRDSLRVHQPTAVYFGSVSFKHQPQPRNLKAMTQLACNYMDVVTTSGEATGVAADLAKIRTMFQAAEKPLGIASGVTPENARQFIPYITWFLVATGISMDFHNLAPALVARLNKEVSPR